MYKGEEFSAINVYKKVLKRNSYKNLKAHGYKVNRLESKQAQGSNATLEREQALLFTSLSGEGGTVCPLTPTPSRTAVKAAEVSVAYASSIKLCIHNITCVIITGLQALRVCEYRHRQR